MKKTQKSAPKKMPKPPVKAEVKKTAPAPMPAVAHVPVESPVQKIPDFKIRPLGDRVLIKEDTESKEQKTASGIIIPISAQEEKAGRRGVVVTIGVGKMEAGKLIPVSVKIGDKVLFQWGDKIRVDDEEYYIVRESEIMAVIK